jgi:hypothetical protein
MKGIVFTGFVEMVEDRFKPAVADRIVGRARHSRDTAAVRREAVSCPRAARRRAS